jgi:hypothetical protein
MRSDLYAERLRVPIESSDRRLRGSDLVVYQVADVPRPAADARVDIRLPVISNEVNVLLADLLQRKYLR